MVKARRAPETEMDKNKKSSNLFSMERIAVVDLGTNTVIFSVVELSKNSLIITYENSITTRIGQNLSVNKTISKEVLQRNIDVISTELEKIRKKYGNIKTIGLATEAVRYAENGPECIKKINAAAKIELEAVTGKSEALYTLEAVRKLYDLNKGTVAVCDIGGGSTEINILVDGKVIKMESIPLGVVRLEEEMHLTNNLENVGKAIEKVKKLLSPVIEKTNTLILCGGTGTTVAALMLSLRSYDPMLVEGYKFNLEILDALLQKLLELEIDDLKNLLVTDVGRADVITAGALIMKVMNDLFAPKDFIITTIGPRHGFVIKKLGLDHINKITYRLN